MARFYLSATKRSGLKAADQGGLVCPLPMRQRSHDCIQNVIEPFTNVFRKKPQNEVPVLLQECVFPAISPIGFGIGQVLRAVEFNHETTLRIKKVHFHPTPSFESIRVFNFQS
jgi:hypothetical protein